jgi:hypothetical protein
MNHLTNNLDLGRIESSLLARRDELIQATAWTFNMTLLAIVLVSFGYFLYVQYHIHQEQEGTEKRIPFTPVPWYSATRNVRSEEYGRQLQPLETEIGYGIPGPADGGSGGAVYETDNR